MNIWLSVDNDCIRFDSSTKVMSASIYKKDGPYSCPTFSGCVQARVDTVKERNIVSWVQKFDGFSTLEQIETHSVPHQDHEPYYTQASLQLLGPPLGARPNRNRRICRAWLQMYDYAMVRSKSTYCTTVLALLVLNC